MLKETGTLIWPNDLRRRVLELEQNLTVEEQAEIDADAQFANDYIKMRSLEQDTPLDNNESHVLAAFEPSDRSKTRPTTPARFRHLRAFLTSMLIVVGACVLITTAGAALYLLLTGQTVDVDIITP